MAPSRLILVNDGQYRWCADAAELVAALTAEGWEYSDREGGIFVEPEGDPMEHYTDLCQLVSEAEGYTTEDTIDEDNERIVGQLAFAEAIQPNGRVWTAFGWRKAGLL